MRYTFTFDVMAVTMGVNTKIKRVQIDEGLHVLAHPAGIGARHVLRQVSH
ncbi:MAG: hypothetical protein IPP94_18585 [Ignavibacteria bacterium]|nr:hypothetical protein [Ignavibacteria bacterium]